MALNNIFQTVKDGMPMDLMAVDIKDALDSLGEVTGRRISSEGYRYPYFSNFVLLNKNFKEVVFR